MPDLTLWLLRIHLQIPLSVLKLGFPSGSVSKESTCNTGDTGDMVFDGWVRKIPWGRRWQPTPVFLPGKSMDKGAWLATIHGVAKNRTWIKQLSMHVHINQADTFKSKGQLSYKYLQSQKPGVSRLVRPGAVNNLPLFPICKTEGVNSIYS